MESNILVTVGIPFYNAKHYLRYSIQSVLNQSYRNFELIVSDDGSNDGSIDIVREFNDDRIRIIADAENKGISYRLNKQIELAKGDIFIRMDADDIMFIDRIKIIVDYFNKYSNVNLIYSNAIIINERNEIVGKRILKNELKMRDFYFKNPIIHPTVAYKLFWIKKYLYIEDMNGVEDINLWLRSYKQGEYLLIDKPLLYYRDFSKINYNTYKFRMFKLIKCYYNYLPDNTIWSRIMLVLIIIYIYTKIFFVFILKYINIDYLFVKLRNKKVNVDNDCSAYLKKCISCEN